MADARLQDWRIGVRGFDFDYCYARASSRARARHIVATAFVDADFGDYAAGLKIITRVERVDPTGRDVAAEHPKHPGEGLLASKAADAHPSPTADLTRSERCRAAG